MQNRQQHVQAEVDAGYLYAQLAAHEPNPEVARVFRELSAIEESHAKEMLKRKSGPPVGLPAPSLRAKIINRIGRWFGYGFVLHVLIDIERNMLRATVASKKNRQKPLTGHEANHVNILRSLLESNRPVDGQTIFRFERQHRSVGGNALRAAVLGGNDGLVSNFGLVMGVAGATDGGPGVLLAGVAGLLAGALSMALGEWISVKSSQELYENQMNLEMEELEINPEGERRELALIYRAKGIPEAQAEALAAELMKDKKRAHEVLVREELGIDPDELKGSAAEAALFSFFSFAFGALLPVLPFLFFGGLRAIVWSAVVSTIGLFFIGATITLFTGRRVWYSGLRQVLFGLAAAAITYLIGRWVGFSLAG
jgi:VIT1/CCC1 family predicted Fe2+/Mn2+ transporter